MTYLYIHMCIHIYIYIYTHVYEIPGMDGKQAPPSELLVVLAAAAFQEGGDTVD